MALETAAKSRANTADFILGDKSWLGEHLTIYKQWVASKNSNYWTVDFDGRNETYFCLLNLL